MLTFYYHPLSPIARRVWLALLEKEIPFTPVIVDLRGEQNKSEFLALNPFHHVPVIVDDGLRLIESLAILDYLEYAYPSIVLAPQSARELGKMRMVQMVTVNELMPKLLQVANTEIVPLTEKLRTELDTVLQFLEVQLEKDLYFGGSKLNLADIVVGATVPLFSRLGISLALYPSLEKWQKNLFTREAWRKSEPNQDDFVNWKRYIQIMIKRYQR